MTTSADRSRGQRAYLLHSRPYRETSALVDFFTPEQGRIRGVLRGVRQPKSRKRELLRAFQPLEIGWRGRGELKTIHEGEACGMAHLLPGRALWCGLYLNEILVRLLPLDEPYPRLFALYRFSLDGLADPDTGEAVLRIFEKRLLEELGFGIGFEQDVNGGSIIPGQAYLFDPAHGFVPSAATAASVDGAVIGAIGGDDFTDPLVRRVAKNLMRRALAVQLGAKPLHSRSLFQRAPAERSSIPHQSPEA